MNLEELLCKSQGTNIHKQDGQFKQVDGQFKQAIEIQSCLDGQVVLAIDVRSCFSSGRGIISCRKS